MSILITGGAGFIGRHTARLLQQAGLDFVVIDNLRTSRPQDACWPSFVRGDISDTALVRSVLRKYAVSAVLHLAASTHAGESVLQPAAYFANNVSATFLLLQAMLEEGVLKFVFASSCSVYGNSALAAHETDAPAPLSPYGESKLSVERMLPWYESAYGLRWTALRYFNAAGAKAGLGEDLVRSNRIVPRAIQAALGGAPLQVFGADFATADGSAVRDYVHVSDVARANLQAFHYLDRGGSSAVINIGSGTGVSVLQIIEAVSKATGRAVPYEAEPARAGNPASAVSDSSLARELLGWEPHCSSLTSIVATALEGSPLPGNMRVPCEPCEA